MAIGVGVSAAAAAIDACLRREAAVARRCGVTVVVVLRRCRTAATARGAMGALLNRRGELRLKERVSKWPQDKSTSKKRIDNCKLSDQIKYVEN